ncbi:E3 SUMO-protein ligase ZBED1-like [Ornithodoros turicata]|uniref:E3 SUMO-protein ligase ZBED1-like n=1 Tax=Ornithodoros turicata TaxID=34597 RepID=UPI003139AB0D
MPPSKKRQRSEIWTHFDKVGGTTAKCKICLKQFSSAGNTSNLWDHLKRTHHRHYIALTTTQEASEVTIDESVNAGASTSSRSGPAPGAVSTLNIEDSVAAPERQPNISEYFNQICAMSSTGPATMRITNTLLFMIVRDCMPLDTVSGEGFKAFVRELNPRYCLPSRRTITKLRDSKFQSVMLYLKTKLDSAKYITLTSDIWTDTLNTRSYIGLTAHFILEGKLESRTLAVRGLAEAHTADNIKSVLESILSEWGISNDKVVSCITDGAANIVKAAENLFGKGRHLHCFAHILNLMASESLHACTNASSLINEVKSIVTFLKQSVKAMDLLRSEQRKNGVADSDVLKPLQEVSTRWNSTYYMIVRYMELHNCIVQVLMNLNGPSILPKKKVDEISEMVLLLKPLEVVTREISAEAYVTVSKVIPLLRCMKNAIERCVVTTDTCSELKDVLIRSFDKRFGNVESNRLVAIATLLDPRFKRLHFENSLACARALSALNAEAEMPTVESERAQ